MGPKNAVAADLQDLQRPERAQGARQGADLIVWPEAAATFLFQPDDRYPAMAADDANYRNQLLQLARGLGKPILFGAPALVVRDERVTGFANRAYLVLASRGRSQPGTTRSIWCPSANTFRSARCSDFSSTASSTGWAMAIPGQQQTLFDVNGAKLSVLICYESIFPDLARRSVKEGADVMVNITNDAWYGTSSAPYQLLAMAAMRSVETKIPMIRVANTGISAIILDDGSITATTPLFQRGTESEDVAWHPMRTLYTIVGDVFADLCLLLTIVAVFWGWRWPRKLKPLEAHVEEILSSRNGKRVAIN